LAVPRKVSGELSFATGRYREDAGRDGDTPDGGGIR
jgi:hypothetical protein